ncbi:MAG: 30S ribosomal protein S15 [Candidatus Nanoarchaeia archaeon]|nr:30S ribosomal protein S15 [Candidatus Nanoarchaeia archaeon]
MAKMHSRARGKSGSRKPIGRPVPSWVTHDAKTVEQLVVKLAKSGNTSSQIGINLRDAYGVPDVKAITKKKINQILEENKLKSNLPEDVRNLIRKDIRLMKHMEINKKDESVKRGLILTLSKILRLAKYYKREGKLPVEWQYDRAKAKVLVES